ncbi:MAG: tetratricopeptide repeat protein [Deltaproteobacteria bacterium]|nr:tetratricopeptide repeat protein [Deltaproteobacteria bacterium]
MPRTRARCPSCGADLTSTAPSPAVRWSDALTYSIHLDDLSGVVDRRALVSYLLGSGRFPDRQVLGERLESVPSELLVGLTLEESTEIKSNLLKLGAQVRAVRTSTTDTAQAPPAPPPPHRARPVRRAPDARALGRWAWAAACLVLLGLVAGIWWLGHDLRERQRGYRTTRQQVEEDARAPLVHVSRRDHERTTGENARAGAVAEIERGHEQFNAGRIRAAIEHYLRARTLDPTSESARLATRDAWVALGETALGELDLDGAREAFDGALRADPDSTRAVRGSGRAAMLAGALDDARREFDRYASLGGDDREALAWSAEVHHSLGDLRRAAADYRAAAGSTGDPRLGERIALVERERVALVEPTARLSVVWLGDLPRGTRRTIEDALEHALDDVELRLGVKLTMPPRVIVDPSQPFSARASLRCGWQMTRLAGPRVPVGGLDPIGGPTAAAAVFRHELAHAVIRGIAGGRVPAWFEEGVAERLTTLGATSAKQPRAQPTAPLASLRWPFASLPPERWDTAFAGADRYTDLLLARGGPTALTDTMTALASGASFEAAVRVGFHVDLSDPTQLALP